VCPACCCHHVTSWNTIRQRPDSFLFADNPEVNDEMSIFEDWSGYDRTQAAELKLR
jgi:hypothetical protein